ncbi:hypothetical protein [Mycoplasma sp. CR]|uniref:hypothetical protein n=1 Tax=Mycoplasma sp. CR TaxID=3401693 RepID=UPI003AAFDEB3
MNKLKKLQQLKTATIIHLILFLITTGFSISIIVQTANFWLIDTIFRVFSGSIYLATLIVTILMLVFTASLTSYVSSDNKSLLWASFIFLFFFPLVSWILNFIVISREKMIWNNIYTQY